VYEAGAIFYPTEAELKAFGDKFEIAIILPPDSGTKVDPPRPEKPEEMTVPQLKDYAKENEIDLGDATKKDDILQKVTEWQEASKQPQTPTGDPDGDSNTPPVE
jgi:hypothetical protein